MREDPNTAAEMRHNTPRQSDAYALDYAAVESWSVALSDLVARIERQSRLLMDEPAAVGEAVMLMEEARIKLADALSSIENARDGG